MKEKLLFINNMAAPYQVKFCEELQTYYDAQIWFYVHLEKNRPNWWSMPLGDKCKVLKGSFYLPFFNYNNFSLKSEVVKFNPDILIVGGFFFPSHYILKRWAKKNNVKFIVLSEKLSYKYKNSIYISLKKNIYKILYWFFKDVDLVLAMGDLPYHQFTQEFGFPNDKVVIAQYPQDIDQNLKHDLRITKKNPTLIFPNRLDPDYNPIFALNVFKKLLEIYSDASLIMNAVGSLKSECENFIQENNLSDSVSFINDIKSWDDLPLIYKSADIALFTATDSNGPNTLIECMASGTGVILSKHIYNTSSYAIHEKNCFISDLNIDSYIGYISQYIQKEGFIAEHGKISKSLVSNRSTKSTAKLFFNILSN